MILKFFLNLCNESAFCGIYEVKGGGDSWKIWNRSIGNTQKPYINF